MSVVVVWGDELKRDYESLWKRCTVSPLGLKYGRILANKILANKQKYVEIEKITGVPWWFIGCLHSMEASLSFAKHLHNGDPLTGRTKQVPKDRPVADPAAGFITDKNGVKHMLPYTWKESAIDAIHIRGLEKNKDWSIAHALYLIEGFNGLGYRQYHPTVKSPYIWSMTSNYVKGKYVADGHYSAEAVSEQCGIACTLKELKIFDADGKLLV